MICDSREYDARCVAERCGERRSGRDVTEREEMRDRREKVQTVDEKESKYMPVSEIRAA